jgi:PAS domain S-box-containing protein
VTPKQQIKSAKTAEGRHDAPGHTEEANEDLQKEIAGRKKAELEIQRQATFARFNPNPVLELSATGEISYFNHAAGAMARALGRETPAQMLPPNTAAMVRDCLAAGTPKLRVETQIGPRVISWSFFPIKFNNTVHCYAGDITERRQAEEALRRSETKFRTLYDSTSNAIMLLGERGFFDCNPATLAIFGCATREEFCSKHPADVSPPIQPDGTDSRTLANRQIATALEKGSHQFEWMHKRADTGEVFPADVLLSVMELDGKRVLLATVRDLTERKQAEMRMQIFSHEIVTARENEKRHLSSVLHHDVGSLAVGISAYLDAIEDDLRSEKPGKALRWMQRTRNLFDQSLKHLKGLAVELRPPELDVLGLGAALRQHFSLVTKRGGIRIRFKEGQNGNRLIGDTAIVLFRVAQEALTNAINHGLAKRVAVDLLTLKKEVRLTIRDNGRGFDPSEQVKLPISHLGLRVMREMADFIEGAFTIDSSPGKGTTVRLTLPIETAPAPAPLPPSPRLWRTGRRGKTIRSDVRSARPQKGSRA